MPATYKGTIKVGQENTPGRIGLPIKGKASNPRIDTDAVIEEILKGALESGVQDILKDVLKGKDSGDI